MCGTLTKAWHTSLQNCVGLLRARPASVAGPSTEPQPGPEAGAERATATEPGPEAGVEHSSEQLPRPDLDTGAQVADPALRQLAAEVCRQSEAIRQLLKLRSRRPGGDV